MPEKLSCTYFPECNACNYWQTDYSKQALIKTAKLRDLFTKKNLLFKKDIDFVSCGPHSLRHRADFTIQFNSSTQKTEFGFYSSSGKLVSVAKCLQMSPELQVVFDEFIKFDFKTSPDQYIRKASVRLRVGPSGQKGCWLDLANLDVKALLDDQTLLRALLAAGYKVEMGQKGKSVSLVNGELKFGLPSPAHWFKGLDSNGRELPLYSLISDFTQPSWTGAKALTQITLDWFGEHLSESSPKILEFGAGIGQFTVSLLSAGFAVESLEIESSACESLKLNVASIGKVSEFTIHNADFHRSPLKTEASALLLNPARSGLKGFCEVVLSCNAEAVVYISCFPESMTDDLKILSTLYEIQDVKIVDQFPQTDHFETCILLKKLS